MAGTGNQSPEFRWGAGVGLAAGIGLGAWFASSEPYPTWLAPYVFVAAPLIMVFCVFMANRRDRKVNAAADPDSREKW